MNTKASALEGLVISETDVATEAVAAALQGRVTIVRESGEIIPSAAFAKMDNNRRILTYLLGLRACALLGLGKGQVRASAENIAETVGIDVQRARECLSRMKGRYLGKDSNGWSVPASRIPAVCAEINEK